MSDSNYWNNRFAENGHTGYKDKFLYAWDQEVRKEIVGKYIQKHIAKKSKIKHRVLDFGCGVGDFTQLMLDKGLDVTAVDISEDVVNFMESRFGTGIRAIAGGGAALEDMDGGYSVIFCITVLQHIESEHEVGGTLDQFYRLLNDNGVLIVLELSKQESNSDDAGAYIFGRSERSWISIFNLHRFGLKKKLIYPQTAVKLLSQIQWLKQVLSSGKKLGEAAEYGIQRSSYTTSNPVVAKNSGMRFFVTKITQAFVATLSFIPDKVLRVNIYRELTLPYRLFILEKK